MGRGDEPGGVGKVIKECDTSVHTREPRDAGESAEDVEHVIAVEQPRERRDIHEREHEGRGPFGACAASRGCVSDEGEDRMWGGGTGGEIRREEKEKKGATDRRQHKHEGEDTQTRGSTSTKGNGGVE